MFTSRVKRASVQDHHRGDIAGQYHPLLQFRLTGVALLKQMNLKNRCVSKRWLSIDYYIKARLMVLPWPITWSRVVWQWLPLPYDYDAVQSPQIAPAGRTPRSRQNNTSQVPVVETMKKAQPKGFIQTTVNTRPRPFPRNVAGCSAASPRAYGFYRRHRQLSWTRLSARMVSWAANTAHRKKDQKVPAARQWTAAAWSPTGPLKARKWKPAEKSVAVEKEQVICTTVLGPKGTGIIRWWTNLLHSTHQVTSRNAFRPWNGKKRAMLHMCRKAVFRWCPTPLRSCLPL